MTVAVALLVSAAMAGWLAPRWLDRADLHRRDPRMLIVAWLMSMAGVAFAAVAGVVLLLIPNHGNVGYFVAALHHCWDAVRHGSPPSVEALGGVVGSAVVAAMAVRLTVIAVRGARKRASRRREHLSVLRLAGRKDNGSPSTLWLAHDEPLAFSMIGRPGVIVATEGLRRHLSAESVAAVLAHERAHLRGRHHLLVATTDALRTALPFVPLFRQAPAAMRELAELAADVAAVRVHGAAAVHAALTTCVSGQAPGVALAMARDAIELRLARLRSAPPAASDLRRAMSCGLAGIAAAAVPLLTAATLLIVMGVATCPIAGS
ncbi:M56 family metallopeptidase [Kibdelosporangium persicum]|uniref:Beta-lactamase regulating signal transducer with metallopeptidase domain n=1 Tax=Kibdelosporangium persicum TaxID=2698649 RepID=A0ABX2FCT4_9PSEU|nr:M56 family metallopeptidase [Kibdelosporangium persicum]NRN69169.1 Beta-lactamase regulating signal transducer with metallopeptidase domain [Kibdelosporangium persicum]